MPTLAIRYETAPEGVAAVTTAIRDVMAGLHALRPEGVRFTYYRLASGNEFMGLLELVDGVENPLPALAQAPELQAAVAKWALGEPPVPQPLEVIGGYTPSQVDGE
jgi:hypothetical protein